MTFLLVIQPEAEADIEQAFDWYEEKRTGLGDDFVERVEQTLADLANDPYRRLERFPETRRALLQAFPYSVFYTISGINIFVLAVLHHRRDPELAEGRSRAFKRP